MDYRDFITSSLEEAAQIANSQFGKVSGITKGEDNNQVLTATDKEIGQLLIRKIQEMYLDYNIIDEETGVIDNHSDYTWVIDPIDGTSNFASGIPLYGIMLGLLHEAKPIAGGIALPYFKEIWLAEKEKGTFCNREKITIPKDQTVLSSLVAYGIDGHQENPSQTREECKLLAEIVLNIRNLRMTNCTALDATWTCLGKYAGTLNKTSKIWDNVAQQIIIEEAGGICTDFYGNPMDYSNALERTKENFTYCAASPAVHQQLQEIIHKPNGINAL